MCKMIRDAKCALKNPLRPTDHGSSGHTHGGVPPPANVRHLTEIVASNADMARGHHHPPGNEEETDEMVPPNKLKVQDSAKPIVSKVNDPGHMNMKGVFLHVLSDALGMLFFYTFYFKFRFEGAVLRCR